MLNVLYKENKDQYLTVCLDKHKQFCLSIEEKNFIKNLLSLIVYYIEFVMIDEEYNVSTIAKILNLLKQDVNNNSIFFYLIEDAIHNEDNSLNSFQVCVLGNYLNKIKPLYHNENLTLALQVILSDYMLNPESNTKIHNLINIALLKLNMPCNEELFGNLCSLNTPDKNVFTEFTHHHECLMQGYENKDQIDKKCLEYVYAKYDRIPKHIRDKFYEANISFCLTNMQLTRDCNLRVLGSTHITIDKIRIWLENNKKSIDISLYHELGHTFDYVCKFYSRVNEEWNKAYKKEKELFYIYKKKQQPKLCEIWQNAISNETEYFAEIFSEYMKDKDELRKIVPLSFQLMETLILN